MLFSLIDLAPNSIQLQFTSLFFKTTKHWGGPDRNRNIIRYSVLSYLGRYSKEIGLYPDSFFNKFSSGFQTLIILHSQSVKSCYYGRPAER
ncbi:MAG: hypothetical protein A2W93_00825 [Bacteroidetes bacterium GWF2_43_63]|nr:MAG: hypothetical protein A2W93_00825 [Bacteroidetes bacterium GWF2_43_63]HBG70823.1 hypothetical protein [Bacteroidales bacterium]